MQNKRKEIKAPVELNKFFEAIFDNVPAEKDKIYKVPAGNTFIKVSGDVINDTYITLQAGLIIPDDTPEEQYVRKFKALQVKVKHLVYEYFRTTKRPGSTKELLDMGKILEAVEKNQVNEDTIKLARKYFDIPPIEFDNFN